ncbi:IspD/TarI family cytidylyltransferase [Microbulbifer sp.]|uniref:IspD/TarI family cytidylyltransferase n=1 Tax=Microbulbifer sp. TaxID=1908541 RepID=UPI003F3F0CF6
MISSSESRVPNPESRIRYWVVVPAAGVGKRMGADRPKQYLPLLGRPLLSLTLRNILSWPGLAGVVVALSEDDADFSHLPEAKHPLVYRVTGGAERADSVLAALNFLATREPPETAVLVHDAARPCVALADIEALLQADSIALLAQPAGDTIKLAGSRETPSPSPSPASGGGEHESRVPSDSRPPWRSPASRAPLASKSAILPICPESRLYVEQTLDRGSIWLAQTPQRAPLGLLHSCLRRALEQGAPVTDEASALELFGHAPQLVPGRGDNLKITHPSDILLAETILRLRYAPTEDKR